MTLYTTDRFASAAASGNDWREAAKKVLEQLTSVLSSDHGYNLGFLYITDALAADAGSIFALFRAATRVQHWVGAAGMGVCGVGESFVEAPAISVMLGCFDEDEVCVFPAVTGDSAAAAAILEPWLDRQDPMLVLAHGGVIEGGAPAPMLAALERLTGGFIAGGLSSASKMPLHFSGSFENQGFSGAIFAQSVEVATALTQGCAPIGPLHTITRCENNVLMELDGKRAFDVFTADLKNLAAKQPELLQKGGAGQVMFRGEVHVAFPVSGSDQRDYQVRQALGIDSEKGWIAVAQDVGVGERVMFVHRDADTARSDLSRMLVDLRKRLSRDPGGFAPAGALYISCVSRAHAGFENEPGGEMALIREIIGDIPLAGFYAGGEISNCRLYAYTGVLILFL